MMPSMSSFAKESNRSAGRRLSIDWFSMVYLFYRMYVDLLAAAPATATATGDVWILDELS